MGKTINEEIKGRRNKGVEEREERRKDKTVYGWRKQKEKDKGKKQ